MSVKIQNQIPTNLKLFLSLRTRRFLSVQLGFYLLQPGEQFLVRVLESLSQWKSLFHFMQTINATGREIAITRLQVHEALVQFVNIFGTEVLLQFRTAEHDFIQLRLVTAKLSIQFLKVTVKEKAKSSNETCFFAHLFRCLQFYSLEASMNLDLTYLIFPYITLPYINFFFLP